MGTRLNTNLTITQAFDAATRQYGVIVAIVVFPLALVRVLFLNH